MDKIRNIFLFLLLLLPLSSQGQQRVPGTPVEMIAPEGFVTAGKFAGFQQESTQSSIFVSLIPVPESIIDQTLLNIQQTLTDPEKLKQQNMQLISQQEIALGDEQVLLLKASQSSGLGDYYKWILVLNDNENIILVNGVFPQKHANDLDQPILDTILSTRVLSDAVISPFDTVNFTIRETQRFVINEDLLMTTALLLNEPNAPHPALPQNHPSLIIAQAFSTVVINQLEAFSRERLSQYPQIKQVKIQHTQQQTIDGLQAFEIEAQARDYETDAPLAVLQVIIADKSTYYIATGLTAYESKSIDFKDFREVIYTFARKPDVKQ